MPYASRIFAVAGIFNLLVGIGGFVAPEVTCGLLGVPLPTNRVFMQLAMWLIIVVGVGYCLTALHPERNRDLMRIGALGKLLVLPIVVLAWRRGDASGAGVVASSGDLVLALLFFDVLRRLPPDQPRRAAVSGTRMDR